MHDVVIIVNPVAGSGQARALVTGLRDRIIEDGGNCSIEASSDADIWFYHRPGTQRWWAERRLGFSRGFREFLESTSPSDMSAQMGRYV